MKTILSSAILAALLPVAATAQSIDDLAQVRVLPGWRTADGAHMAALEITLQPGWITYWRAPGDAGIPPQFAFSGDPAIASITPHWPTPAIFGDKGMLSIGYSNRVTVPLEIDVSDGTGAFAVSGDIQIGVCEEICIPVTLPFSALLPPSGTHDTRIDAALDAGPVSGATVGVGPVSCRIDPIADGLQLTARIALPQGTAADHVVVEARDPRIWVSEATISKDGSGVTAQVDMIHPTGGAFALDRAGLRFTVLGGERAIDIAGCSAG